MVVFPLGDVPFGVCLDQGDNPFSMIGLLDRRFASTRTSSLFAVLATLFGKRHSGKEDMSVYIDKGQQLFTKLEKMGSNAISEQFKVPLLLFKMNRNSPLESTNIAFRTKDINALK